MAAASLFLRRSAGWATGSRTDPFRRASLRLTAVFLGIAAALVIAFSLVLYFSIVKNIESNVAGDFATEAAQARFISRTVAGVRNEILMIAAAILLLISGVSHVFARRTMRPVQHNLEAQKQFISNASHELRTPLTVMKTEFQVARRSDPDAVDIDRLLDDALEDISRMGRIVDDLLTLSRMDADQEQSALAPVKVDGLLERAVEEMRPYAASHEISLSVAADSGATILADAQHLERALLNIIKNAVEHSAPETTVTVGLAARRRAVEIAVADCGDGIPSQSLAHVFERFYSVPGSSPRCPGGSGLGLAVAQGIVHQHRGSISIVSEVGQGTTVTVVLPRPSRRSSSLHPRFIFTR